VPDFVDTLVVMEHRGIEYQVVEVDRERGGHGGWKWSVRLSPYTSASGTEANRVAAITAAERKIDLALAGGK
jgi:hypothetical protein